MVLEKNQSILLNIYFKKTYLLDHLIKSYKPTTLLVTNWEVEVPVETPIKNS